ncbi:hypothetical protein ACLOJK_035071 [Asimina triloba]
MGFRSKNSVINGTFVPCSSDNTFFLAVDGSICKIFKAETQVRQAEIRAEHSGVIIFIVVRPATPNHRQSRSRQLRLYLATVAGIIDRVDLRHAFKINGRRSQPGISVR